MVDIVLTRAYERPSADDGFRVLVDRLWPRGLNHERLPYDLWAKDIAPSVELRRWFHADPAGRWAEFASRYAVELRESPEMKSFVAMIACKPKVTLLYGSRDPLHNHALVIRDTARSMLGEH